jgi:hypothetical protein
MGAREPFGSVGFRDFDLQVDFADQSSPEALDARRLRLW